MYLFKDHLKYKLNLIILIVFYFYFISLIFYAFVSRVLCWRGGSGGMGLSGFLLSDLLWFCYRL
jgi:hypothetical protein